MLLAILVLYLISVFPQGQEQPFHKVLTISCSRIDELHLSQWISIFPSFWSHISHFLGRWRFHLVFLDHLAYTWLPLATLQFYCGQLEVSKYLSKTKLLLQGLVAHLWSYYHHWVDFSPDWFQQLALIVL